MVKTPVTIRIESRSGSQTINRTLSGELYRQGEQAIVRYMEQEPEMGRTSTTVKCKADSIKIIRHGDVESDQSFELRRRVSGTYRTPQGRLFLETFTHRMNAVIRQHGGTIEWEYDLFVSGEHAGTYRVKLVIVEVE